MAKRTTKAKKLAKITTSSTAEYFSKNLQQVGFSSATKAVLTTLKEAVDNSLDACEEAGILPELSVEIEKAGSGTIRNTDLIRIKVTDNGPGLDLEDVPKVFGEYLASSKFGRGRCSRGQQGIGISAATTWAQLTSAKGAKVVTKTKRMRQAVAMDVHVDIKHNKGLIKKKETVKWDGPHGTSVEFFIDGRIQLNGEGGLITYLTGNTLVNPHLTLNYKLLDQKWVKVKRVTEDVPRVPDATPPHPHTMKLGEFISHSHLFGKTTVGAWLKKGFSRVSDNVINEMVKGGLEKRILGQTISKTPQAEFKQLFTHVQKMELMAPTTRSVMTIGEDSLAKSIRRLGDIDFFSVMTRRPKICDFKPVAVEVAIARLSERDKNAENESLVTVLRFANRVPLQFDKSGCAMFKAVESVNWRSYGLSQSKGSIPSGPYVIAVSLVSPFIKFKNASKETVDASDELVEEIRRALMQAGQRLSRHIRREAREADLEKKIQHIEQFCPILVACLVRITKAPAKRKKAAIEGLMKLLGREVSSAEKDLKTAEQQLQEAAKKGRVHHIEKKKAQAQGEQGEESDEGEEEENEQMAEAKDESVKGAKAKPSKKAKGKPKRKARK